MRSGQGKLHLPPTPNADEITRPEMQRILRALRTPVLWAFSALAGAVGLRSAVEVCGSRELPDVARPIFERGQWTADDLPPREVVEKIILGARVKALRQHGKHSLKDVAMAIGTNYYTAARALATLEMIARDAKKAEEDWKEDIDKCERRISSQS